MLNAVHAQSNQVSPDVPAPTRVAACPFCNDVPTFSEVTEFDDRRYKQMSLNCCITMATDIPFSSYSAMSDEAVEANLREELTKTWGKRVAPKEVLAAPDLRGVPRYRWGAMSMNREIAVDQGYYLVKDVQDICGELSRSTVSHDFRTHRESWRNALVLAQTFAAPKTVDSDEEAYWKRELKAYDNAFDELLSQGHPKPYQQMDSAAETATLPVSKSGRLIYQALFNPVNCYWMDVTEENASEAKQAGITVRTVIEQVPSDNGGA